MLFKTKSKYGVFCLKLLLVLGVFAGFMIQFPLFAKTIIVSIDGVEREVVLKGLYVSDLTNALNQQYGIDNYTFHGGAGRSTLLADIDKLSISIKKTIKIKSQHGEREFTTFAATLEELIREVNFEHAALTPELLATTIQNNMTLEEKRIEQQFDIEVIENAELDEGIENVLQEGESGIVLELFSFFNDQMFKLGSNVIQTGTKRIIERGTKHVSIAPHVPLGSIWDSLAFCESRGRWDINTGNGYYGGVQFSAPTWRTASRAVGLNIPYAHLATRDEQIMAATWLQKRAGWGQWPHCARQLGLR